MLLIYVLEGYVLNDIDSMNETAFAILSKYCFKARAREIFMIVRNSSRLNGRRGVL